MQAIQSRKQKDFITISLVKSIKPLRSSVLSVVNKILKIFHHIGKCSWQSGHDELDAAVDYSRFLSGSGGE
jgi:hypothetical protein